MELHLLGLHLLLLWLLIVTISLRLVRSIVHTIRPLLRVSLSGKEAR